MELSYLSVHLPGALMKEFQAPGTGWIPHKWVSGDLLCCSVPSLSAPLALQGPRVAVGSSGALGDTVMMGEEGRRCL